MSAQHALAARAEAAIAPAPDTGRPDIQPVAVPEHWPPPQWPPDPFTPDYSGHQDGGRAGVRAGLAGHADAGPVDADRADAVPADGGQGWPRQFAVLLAEALAGVRPVRQLQPWLSERGSVQLHRLLPLFADGHRPHVTRVLTKRPTGDAIEMTLIVTVGPRTRALAVRLERTYQAQRPAWGEKLTPRAATPRSPAAARWHCTDIEAA